MEKISTYNDLLKKYKECKKKIEVRENPENLIMMK